MTEAAKANLREIHKNGVFDRTGMKASPETIRRLSESHKRKT
jgi:hypothetical protein